MKVDFGQGEKEALVSVWTLSIYEQEFGSDMIQDLFGEEVVKADNEDDDNVIFKFDYHDFNWTAATKALWAALKCADPDTQPYAIWARELGDIDLWSIIRDFLPEVRARLFRPSADSEEEEEDGAEQQGD